MCGLCGLWRWDGAVSAATVIAMRDAMAHRGPDGASGVLMASADSCAVPFGADGPAGEEPGIHDVGLGHRRLSIIDLELGGQPMATEDRRTWLVYNGEIYNYRELREQLNRRGHAFYTQSDTEVLLRAYEEFGPDCPRHLNGIFAFAVWDGPHRRLFIARDHFGVKPLYYASTPRGFVFASEIKAMLASGLVSPALDVNALGLALTFRYTPAPFTLFSGIRKLAPGSSVIIERDRVSEPRFFAESSSTERNGRADAPWAPTLASAMERAVHRQMVSDVPVGLSLSSGVDSSMLLALMSHGSAEPIRAFTIGFGAGSDYDEVPAAERVADRYTARFQARQVGDAEYAGFMTKYMWHMEEPVGNESAPAYFFVAKMARDAGVKVLLTGQGPDELFAGYDRHIGLALGRILRAAGTPWLRTGIKRATRGRAVGEKYRRLLASATSPTLDQQLLGAYTIFSPEDAKELLRPEVYTSIDWGLPMDHIQTWLRRAPPGTALDKMLWIDARTVLSDNLLMAEDKMAMAASVEARVPFLDLEFANLAESVPASAKLRLGRRKQVYRQACAQWIGAEASRRRKIGFANPMAQWFRGCSEQSILSEIEATGSFVREYAEPRVVARMMAEHRAGLRDHTRKLYFLISLEAWYKGFFS